jgi:thiamine biosynthesis protein ThiS
MDKMDIIVNGKTNTVRANASIANLITILALDGKRFAIELNKELVLRSNFDTTHLHAGDKIEIVGAIGGG